MIENQLPPELEFAAESDAERAERVDRRLGRTRLVAWIVIGALVLAGGGATVLSLLLG